MKRNNIYIIQLISALVLLFSSCSQEELMDQPGGCIRFRQDSPPAIPVTTGRHPDRYGSWRK